MGDLRLYLEMYTIGRKISNDESDAKVNINGTRDRAYASILHSAMTNRFISLVVLVASLRRLDAADVYAATYSIVAYEPSTGEWGVAAASKYFSVGSVVPFVEPGVGVVASQALLNPAFGPGALALLRSGQSAPRVVRELVSRDPDQSVRQLAVIDSACRVSVHTGLRTAMWAGSEQGQCWSVQGNILIGPKVLSAMSRSYLRSKDLLMEDRLLIALEAGEDAGGDRRGKQSACILVARQKTSDGRPSRTFLNIEDSDAPLAELRLRLGKALFDTR